MSDKNTIIATLLCGTVYVTSMFFLAAQEVPEFWFWSSVMAWGFLAALLIQHLRTYKPPARDDGWKPEEQEVLRSYVQKSSDLLVTKWSPAIALVIYESIIIMLLSTTNRGNFSKVHALLDDVINSNSELTDTKSPAITETRGENDE